MAEVEMMEVKSSSIKSVGHDEEEKQLHVRFVTGALYIYDLVPKEVFDELINADSVGKYFAANIKGQYGFTKV